MTHEGQLSIGRVQGAGEDVIRLRLECKRSAVRFVEVELTPHDLAMALTGMGATPCTFELTDTELVGLERQHKTVVVRVASNIYGPGRGKAIKAALAPHEVDGWRASRDDCVNSHRVVKYGDGWYECSVLFERHV
jgi:hypothetical protein